MNGCGINAHAIGSIKLKIIHKKMHGRQAEIIQVLGFGASLGLLSGNAFMQKIM
ncbi:MAG: hypothetical protein ACPL3B_01550 [Fervidobacterium sp.]